MIIRNDCVFVVTFFFVGTLSMYDVQRTYLRLYLYLLCKHNILNKPHCASQIPIIDLSVYLYCVNNAEQTQLLQPVAISKGFCVGYVNDAQDYLVNIEKYFGYNNNNNKNTE